MIASPLEQQQVLEKFGFNWWAFSAQVFSFALTLVALGLAVLATKHCLRHRRGELLPWLFFTWSLPYIGPIYVLWIAGRRSISRHDTP